MLHHLTILRCSQTTAFFLFIIIGAAFIFTGCTQIYKVLGLTEEQTHEQISEDQKTIIRTITTARTTAADILTSALAGLGAIATGFLSKWLTTERKITATLIKTVEASDVDNLKTTIKTKATAAGVETQLHKRVTALT